MMIRTFLLSILMIFCFGCSRQAEMKVVGSTELNFGDSNVADTLKGHFLVTNMGSQELKIKGVQASCGCVSVAISDSVISFGDTTRLDVKQVPRKAGQQEWTIVVAANGVNPFLELTTITNAQ